ncbi:unnamed protein product, partial [Diabrotica balteata]
CPKNGERNTMFLVLLAVFITSLVAKFYWSRRHLYAAAAKIQGPKGLPIVGNALSFFCDSEDILEKIKIAFEPVKHEPLRFWLGPYLLIALKNPVHLEKIMSSQKFAYKHDLYEFLEKFGGDGLITASGLKPKYKIHRRLLQPMFNLSFVKSTLPIMNERFKLCMEELEKFANGKTFDIVHVMEPCSMGVIAEIVMGQKLNSQSVYNIQLSQVMSKLLYCGFTRMVKLWLHSDFIYNLHPLKKEQDDALSALYHFINEAITDSWARRKFNKTNTFIPVLDILTEIVEQNSRILSREDLVDHLTNIISASQDPFSIISSFSIVCFGMYPEYQAKAVDEIKNVIGEKPREITLEDVYKLEYLDMCVKDVLRLFPIAPIILRKSIEDYHLDEWTIPKGAAIAVPIYFLHRDPEYWKNPDHFYPDHFLPEFVQKRHPYAYMPFSAGPRGCIGKTLANIEIRLFMAMFLQTYEVEADGTVPLLKLRADISTRAKFGYNCRINKRNWNIRPK